MGMALPRHLSSGYYVKPGLWFLLGPYNTWAQGFEEGTGLGLPVGLTRDPAQEQEAARVGVRW